MAHMDIHYGHSVNGVAYLHTEILKNSELNSFLQDLSGEIQQQDKWNHIPPLAAFTATRSFQRKLKILIGSGFKKDACEA